MGYDSGGASQDSRDDDDEEEYEEGGSGNRFLGFMFGNVDNSGDLDADYLDEEAKEHLAALADKLGSSLTDIDLSIKSPRTQADASEQDYDEKAEDAVDYEDIDEQYEGPEVQAATEEENLFPEKEYLSAQIPFTNMSSSNNVFDDENYDEDEEPEKEQEMVDKSLESQIALSEVQASGQEAAPKVEVPSDHELHVGTPDEENFDLDLKDDEEMEEAPKEPSENISPAPLPVLCIENGMVILRFSEIFGIQESSKRRYKRDHMFLMHKEKVKSIDASDLVEEDEEAFLRGFSQEFSSMKQEHQVHDDVMKTMYDEMVSEKFGLKANVEMLDSFLSGARMKEDLTIDLSTVWEVPQSPNFYPLDQQDWENSILWDADSPGSDNSAEVHDIYGLNMGVKEVKSDGYSIWSSPMSKNMVRQTDSEDTNLVVPAKMSHPQLLRLESCEEAEDSSHPYGMENTVTAQFSKFSLQNQQMMEGSWLNDIIWEPNRPITRQKLILDLEDRQMLFEVVDEKNESELWLHAGAMLVSCSSESHGHDSLELPNHGNETYSRFDIANDIFYSNRKTSQQLNTNSEKRTSYGVEVYHSAPALKLETTKPKLSNKDIANFHRPKALWYPHDNEVFKERGKLPTQGPMKIIVKSLGGKGSKLHVDSKETISSIKAKASKKLDFKPSEPVKIFYRGKELEDDKSLSAQNVQPNSLLHVVRTKIHLLPRAQKIPSENKSLRPPGAFKKKSELSVKDGHVFLMEYCEERPLLLSNVGMGARFCTYYQKTAPSDQTGNLLSSENRSLGSLLALDPADKSPFLGEIKPGSTQSSLETNMFRSPVFPHKVSSTDYLLVRSAKGKLSIRRIDKINVVGQQEPLMEVMSPGSKELQYYLLNRVVVHMFREFRALKKRNLTPCILADELVSHFPHLSEAFHRNRLKKNGFADLKRGPTGQWIWKLRPNVNIPSEEALRKHVPPEKVCAYESMQAGLYRLKHLGITRLMNPTVIASAMSQLPNEAIALAAASHIERELQITPWSLSSNFVACTNQVKENLERLEISGVGDPSGRGLGFSYVRSTPKAPVSNAMTKKKAAAKGTTVTGTDADLRRLSMEAAREVLLKFNVPDEVIAKQTRWHRIAMIREFSSEQAASGVKVDPTTIGKYARGQRMSFVQLQQQTREKCQDIWDRQFQSLTAIDEGASDSESNSDLDSFAGDLENLLDAEECEGDEVINEPKHDRSDSVKGLKMRRYPSQTEVQEKDEDEAAEAAELCRMLMDDEKTGLTKKKKAGLARKEVGAVGPLLGFGSENVERIKKPKKMVKQIISSIQPDKAYNGMENILGEKKDGEVLAIKDDLLPKVKAKKVKILGDGMKIFKEKKSARESFVCGACGQLGHMRTNKNCPRYGEDPEAQADRGDPDKVSAKSSSLDPSSQHQQKHATKKVAQKSVGKTALVEAPECEKSLTKVKSLKLKCGSVDKILDNTNPGPTRSSDQMVLPVADNKPNTKVSKIVISSKSKQGEVQVESQKPNIVIRPPDRGQAETPKASIVFRPPMAIVQSKLEPPKPSIVIKPPTDIEKEQTQKRIKIRRPKEVVDLDQVSQEGSVDFDYRKTKKIVELSGFDNYGRNETGIFSESSSKRKPREDQRWWEEEEKRRHAEMVREERTRRLYMEETRMLEEQERLAEIERYEVSIRREREEEERLKAKKKKKKMKRPEVEYVEEDYRGSRRNDGRPDRDRTARRKPEVAKVAADFGPPTKRRRGGEVGLANILEHIVEVLRSRQEVSYLFLKPVTKKEAPDYLDIVKKPMDLSTIREKVRRLEYKSRNEFRHDVWQIAFNAHLYNDRRNPGIPPLADQLLELCDYLLDEHTDSLDEAEEAIED
ncbi:transcription initiation factor TFIID subunit 1 isoform X2 [Punica granatum]|uniref:Transcription initiation factor TFIID subunit 1 n=1 Tax=Punica granatum TaxID=22663 RepID=A0A6P8DK82_PUNGR|nr:transcription initiation factor TFIID subunit 1 isoform X2 [Punica granatum]